MLSITVKLPNGSKKPLNVNRSETVRKVVEMCMGDQATKWTLKCPGGKEPGKTKTLEAAGVPNGAMCSLKAMPKSKNTRAKEKRNAAAASGAECAAKRQKKEPEAVSGADAPSPAAVAMPVASEPVPAATAEADAPSPASEPSESAPVDWGQIPSDALKEVLTLGPAKHLAEGKSWQTVATDMEALISAYLRSPSYHEPPTKKASEERKPQPRPKEHDLYAMIVEQGIHHIPDSPWASPGSPSPDPPSPGRVRWGARSCTDESGCGRCFCKTCYPAENLD